MVLYEYIINVAFHFNHVIMDVILIKDCTPMKFKSLRLYAQLIIIVGSIWVAVLVIITLTSKYYIEGFNQQLTADLDREIQHSIETIILTNNNRLVNLSTAHTGWTELVDATNAKDRAWVQSNATKYLLDNPAFSVNTLYLLNTDNNFTELYGALPKSIYAGLLSNVNKNAILTTSEGYLISYNKQLFIVTITGLTKENRKTLHGVYALGQRIDPVITTTLKQFYASKSDFDLTFTDSEAPIISLIDPNTLVSSYNQYFTLNTSNNSLAKSINDHANKLLYLILSIIAVSMILLLSILMRLTGNFEESIKRIKRITYHDYSQKIDLNFSKDFSELSQCINNLSSELSSRDEEINQKYIEIISILIKTLEEVDVYTKGHSERVSHYSVALATVIGYPELEIIRLSGLLHDIGKITVDIKILNNPGKLSESEFEEIKKHPMTAYNILGVSDIFNPVKAIVRGHHEKMDGSGYPDGLRGDDIPLGARIVAIADVFDSLTSERSYRKEMPLSEALQIIQNGSGTHFDKALVDAFIPIAIEAYKDWSSLNQTPDVEELLLILEQ